MCINTEPNENIKGKFVIWKLTLDIGDILWSDSLIMLLHLHLDPKSIKIMGFLLKTKSARINAVLSV